MKPNTKQNKLKKSINFKKLTNVVLIFVFLFAFVTPGFADEPNSVCQITCPPNMNVVTAEGLCDVVVNYPPLTVTGDCMGINYYPPDGSSFHVGTTPVTITSNSGQLCTLQVIVTATPISGGIIHGPDNVCRGTSVTYCRAPVQGAVSYSWQLPAGVTGSSTTNCITVTIGPNFTSGTLFGTATSGCSSSTVAAKLMDVALTKPAKPADIHLGGGSVCAGSSPFFCCTFVPGAEEYIYTIDGNGQNAPLTFGQQISSCIRVNIPAGYNNKQQIKVKTINCMGQSAETKLDIKAANVPNMPGNITGPASVCKSQLGFYSISNVTSASQYNWSVTNDVHISGGQGTTNLALDFFSASSNSTLLSVTSENGCGISAPRTKMIAINTACREASDLSNGETLIDLDATVYPNPTTGRVTIQFTSTNDSDYKLNVYDMMGRIVFKTDVAATEGLNQLDFDLSSLSKQVYLLRLENASGSRTIRLGVE
jgi:hypothetical protein